MIVKKVEKLTLRLPGRVHRRLIAYQQQKPHMSLNAIIVEAISEDLDRQDREMVRE